MRRFNFLFFLAKKETKFRSFGKMKKECSPACGGTSCLFSGPTHKDSDNFGVVYEFVVIVEDLAACYE